MRFILGNSVKVATGSEMELHHDLPIDFEEIRAFDFSVPPTSPTEPLDRMSSGSLPSPRREIIRAEFADTSPFSDYDSEPAGRGFAGFVYVGSRGEFNEPRRSEFDDFLAPSDAHALSDWPL